MIIQYDYHTENHTEIWINHTEIILRFGYFEGFLNI